MRNIKSILLAAVALTVLNCGSHDSSPGADHSEPSVQAQAKVFWGSCLVVEAGTSKDDSCHEWYGEDYRNVNIKGTCRSFYGGNFSLDKCTQSENFVGACLRDRTDSSEARDYYYDSKWTRDEAFHNCSVEDANGEWADPRRRHSRHRRQHSLDSEL